MIFDQQARLENRDKGDLPYWRSLYHHHIGWLSLIVRASQEERGKQHDDDNVRLDGCRHGIRR